MRQRTNPSSCLDRSELPDLGCRERRRGGVMKAEDLRQIDETPETAGDLRQVQAAGITEDQLQELLHIVEGVVRQWISGSQTSSKLSRRPRSCGDIGGGPRPPRPCGSRRTTLPDSFGWDAELAMYAGNKLPEVDMVGLMEQFRLQAEAKRWIYADWRRAFQMYVRNVAPNSGHWSQNQYPKLSSQIDWTKPVDAHQIKW